MALDWFIEKIPSPATINGLYRKSPASNYVGLGSLSHQQNTLTHLLDFVSAGGGGGGIKIRQEYEQEYGGLDDVPHPAEMGWYAATWANVYYADGFFGTYNTAGKPGLGYGGGGGGASSPWSNPSTWTQGKGALGHFTITAPSNALLNPLTSLPSRGNYSDAAAGRILPNPPYPNARGMLGPPGGAGAGGLIVIYY